MSVIIFNKTYLKISFKCFNSPLRQSPSLTSCKFCSLSCPTSVSNCAIFSNFLILDKTNVMTDNNFWELIWVSISPSWPQHYWCWCLCYRWLCNLYQLHFVIMRNSQAAVCNYFYDSLHSGQKDHLLYIWLRIIILVKQRLTSGGIEQEQDKAQLHRALFSL